MNCPIARELCPKITNPLETPDDVYDKVVSELASSGEIIAETKLDLPANSVRAIGIAVPDDDAGDETAIALLGGGAPGRLKFDIRDVLRLGFAKR